jgi:hypothetical protein
MKRKKIVLLASLCIVVLSLTYATGALANTSGTTQTRAFADDPEKSVYTNQSAYVLGAVAVSTDIGQKLSASTSKITSVSDITSLSVLIPEKDMLFVDGQWLQTNLDKANAFQTFRQLLLKGIPIIFIQGAPKDALSETLAGLSLPTTVTEVPTIAVGYKYYPETGQSSLLNIGGIPNQAGKDLSGLVNVLYKWGSDYLTNIPPIPEAAHHSPSWGATPIYWFQWYSYDTCSPYGRAEVYQEYYQLSEDGSPSYKWYTDKMRISSWPGCLVWNNGYHTMDMYNYINVGSNNYIVAYGPETDTSTVSHSVNIGVTAGQNGAAVTLGQAWTYTCSSAPCARTSTDPYHYNLWTDVSEESAAGTYAYAIQPGVTVRVPETGQWSCPEEAKIVWGYRIWPLWFAAYTFDLSFTTTL